MIRRNTLFPTIIGSNNLNKRYIFCVFTVQAICFFNMLNSPIVESKKITSITRINQYILEHKWCRYIYNVVITNKYILVVRYKKYCDRDTLCDLSCARCDKLWARVFIVRLKYYAVQKILCRVHKLLYV